MATIKFDGFKGGDAYGAKLEMLANRETRSMIRRAVGRGAVRVADAIEAALRAIPSCKPKMLTGTEQLETALQNFEKAHLLNALGITPVDTDARGFVNAKVGFDGYTEAPTAKYSRGTPIPMLAASVERGSSVRPAHPFIEPTVRKIRKDVIRVMEESIDTDIKEIFEK